MEIKILGYKMRIELIVLSILVGSFIGANVFCNCSGGVKEGFNVARQMTGSVLNYSMGKGVKGSWDKPNNSYNYNSWFKHLDGNTQGYKPPFPVRQGQLDMLAKNKFDPNCCPSTYSSSTGCLCVTPDQMKYLNERGGNRTFATEY